MAFGHFLLGSHNFMVTALGSCVKWPYVVCSALIVCTRCVSVLIVFLDCANVRASGGAIKRST